MKKILFSILAMAAMAACATDETVVASKGEAIEFGNAFVDNSVRATDPTYSGETKELTAINVYGAINDGVVIFDATPVTGSVGESVWTCDVTQYWIAGANYKFAAVADVADLNEDIECRNGIPTAIFYDASVPATDGSQRDLLYAYEKRDNVQPTYAPVNFSFRHLLAKVNVTFQNTTEGAADDYNIDVRNITITNPYKYATCNITYNDNGTWTPAWLEEPANAVAIDPNYKVEFGDILNVQNGQSATIATEKLLIPTTQTLEVKFTVDICNGNTVITTTDYEETIETDLVAGYSYNIVIKQSLGSKIQFTVIAAPTWADAADDEIES